MACMMVGGDNAYSLEFSNEARTAMMVELVRIDWREGGIAGDRIGEGRWKCLLCVMDCEG